MEDHRRSIRSHICVSGIAQMIKCSRVFVEYHFLALMLMHLFAGLFPLGFAPLLRILYNFYPSMLMAILHTLL